MSQRHKKGYRWNFNDKMIALSIYYQSRKAYKVLKKIFRLPSKSTLQRSLQKTDIRPGFNTKILNAMEVKAKTMSSQDRLCALVLDEMSIKEFAQYDRTHDTIEGFVDLGESGRGRYLANHALVFMLRGLHAKWKQPIAYFLSSGPVDHKTLKVLVDNCLEKVENTGLVIKILICDQGSNNRSLFKNISKSKTSFTFNNREIYLMYDPPHLLKSIRNNLMKHGFAIGKEEIKWEHVVNFYEFDSSLAIRMAPKLSHKHIHLPPFSKMRVNLAAQVLSHTVAAGISTLVKLNQLPQEAISTASFIENFDELFNAFNSKTLKSKQKMGHAFTEKHVAFLEDKLKWISNIKLTNGKTVPCLEGWILSIKSLTAFWKDVTNNHGFKFLLTNRLNQDCLENLFSIIRGKGGNRDNPTPQQFRAAFRQIVVEKLLEPSPGSNCQSDYEQVLLDLSLFTTTSTSAHDVHNNNDIAPGPIQTYTFTQIQEIVKCSEIMTIANPPCIPTQNIASYIAGYLLRKCPPSQCDQCVADLIQSHNPDDQRHIFITEKAYCANSLIHPSTIFSLFIDSLEQIFTIVFPVVMYSTNVIASLVSHTEDKCKSLNACDQIKCMTNTFKISTLYMKIRMHHALKTSNISHSEPNTGKKRNRKVLKLKHI